jgi:hypothetical protein
MEKEPQEQLSQPKRIEDADVISFLKKQYSWCGIIYFLQLINNCLL